MRIDFIIIGPPQGKGRPSFVKSGFAYTPKKTKEYEEKAKILAMEAMFGQEQRKGPIRITILAFLPIPQSWTKKKKEQARKSLILPTKKPDLDNIAKIILDSCNEVIFKDDSQVVGLSIKKFYSDNARVEVSIFDI